MKAMNTKESQLKLLENQILGIPNLTGTEKFAVFPIEAGLGKTNTLISAMVKQYRTDSSKTSLIVTRLIDEGKRIESAINQELNNQNVAHAWDSSDENSLYNYRNFPILIITHAKYKWLNNSYNSQHIERLFLGKRTNLIIDEEFHHYEVLTLGKTEIGLVSDTLSDVPELRKKFDVMADKWEDLIKKYRYNKNPVVVDFPSREVDEYINELMNSILSFNFPERYFQNKHIKTKEALMEKITPFYDLYNNQIIFADGKININASIRNMFTYKNNIIMDGSASINCAYELDYNKKYNLICLPRIVDHSNWNLHWYKDNTSIAGKSNKKEFTGKILQFISERIGESDKALIINSKIGNEALNKQLKTYDNLKFANYSNMSGRNDWHDFNKCFILQTPILNNIDYSVAYMTITGKRLNDCDLKYELSNGYRQFVNNDNLQHIVDDQISCALYQAIKRINRDRECAECADVYLFCNREEAVKKVIESMPNIRVVDEGMLCPREYDTSNRQSQHVQKLLQLLSTGVKERDKNATDFSLYKKEIRAKLGIEKQHLTKLLNDKVIRDYMNDNNIESTGQRIFSQYKKRRER